MKSIFDTALELMQNQDQESLLKSMDNVHHEGLFSLVIGGTENCKLTRVFIATKKIKPFTCQLHTHTYDLSIGVIQGQFEHHTAVRCGEGARGMMTSNIDTFKYRSPLNGGNGLEYIGDFPYHITSQQLPPGAEFFMDHNDIHTVSCSKGTMWIVQEHGLAALESQVVGRRFILDGLYTQPKQYQINDNWQKVKAELEKIVAR